MIKLSSSCQVRKRDLTLELKKRKKTIKTHLHMIFDHIFFSFEVENQ